MSQKKKTGHGLLALAAILFYPSASSLTLAPPPPPEAQIKVNTFLSCQYKNGGLSYFGRESNCLIQLKNRTNAATSRFSQGGQNGSGPPNPIPVASNLFANATGTTYYEYHVQYHFVSNERYWPPHAIERTRNSATSTLAITVEKDGQVTVSAMPNLRFTLATGKYKTAAGYFPLHIEVNCTPSIKKGNNAHNGFHTLNLTFTCSGTQTDSWWL